ncbi:MAG: prepilin-type N-terminal cleavage/methylation domain-containing protein [Candidatus Wallbacteria bacterium]|nr:prepilin-type N-terminal cleavage/methylation domain-containing protein [Candidatus Wallbacteria bacterium]
MTRKIPRENPWRLPVPGFQRNPVQVDATGSSRLRTQAFTLIELMVALVIGLIVLGLLWTLISAMTRGFASSRDLLNSLQGAHLLVEYVKNDLGGCFYAPGTRPVEVSPDYFELTFYCHDPDGAAPPALPDPQAPLERVTYKFDAATGMVSRNGKAFNFARFERVVFYYKPPDYDAVPDKVFGNYVTLRVTCASDEVIEINRTRSDRDRVTRNVVTLITSLGLSQKASQEIFPRWNPPEEPVMAVR